MKPIPIRWKFAGWAAALAGVTLIFYSAATLVNLYQEQIEAVDLELAADGHRLISLAQIERIRDTTAEEEKYAEWVAHAIFNDQGDLVRLSPRLPEMVARQLIGKEKPQTLRSGKERWRMASFANEEAILIAAYNLDEVGDIMSDLLMAYAFSLPIVVGIAGVGGWWVAGRALKPIHNLTSTIERIQAERLDQRVPLSPASDELQRLSIVFNAMLARLEKSFEQAQRFAADASHELRTPLTILRGEIDRLLRAPGIQPEHQVKLVSVQEEIERLQHITDNLLLLARFDSGTVRFDTRPLNFSQLVKEACEDAELLAESQKINILSSLASGIQVLGDEKHLRRVVLNLLDNAVKFNLPNGEIRCVLENTNSSTVLSIRNTGPGISLQQRERLFQRFFRGDPSRASTQGHGLGLSLSREIARLHGGDLRCPTSVDDKWTEFTLTLPTAPPA